MRKSTAGNWKFDESECRVKKIRLTVKGLGIKSCSVQLAQTTSMFIFLRFFQPIASVMCQVFARHSGSLQYWTDRALPDGMPSEVTCSIQVLKAR